MYHIYKVLKEIKENLGQCTGCQLSPQFRMGYAPCEDVPCGGKFLDNDVVKKPQTL